MRTEREIFLMLLLSVVALVGAFVESCFGGDPGKIGFLLMVNVGTAERRDVWKERRKRIEAERQVEIVQTAAAGMVLAQARGEKLEITTPGCTCSACRIKRALNGEIPPS